MHVNEEEAETVYLERTSKGPDDPEVLPIPATKETVIEDLKIVASNYEDNTNRYFWGITGLSFGLASFMTFL